MPRNLFLAFLATWAIHAGYLLLLTFKSARLRREYEELKRQRAQP
jgi:hypothetical protein